jgi:oxygen-independent coproporphyrinogen-3 oxidase
VPSTPPPGEPAPSDGSLPASAVAALPGRAFGVYIHVPFCASRCGYCDFNTYTAAELGGGGGQSEYAAMARAELRLAARVLGPDRPPASTVFFGGGTPTLLPAADLAAMLRGVVDELGLAADAEVTTEANPESVDERSLDALRSAGFTRISLGMQSAVPHVLATLDRAHSPGRAESAARWARAAGFEHVSLDLIYGTPGESTDDWRRSLDAAVAAEPDHVSAYALVVEPGTRMATTVRRGLLNVPSDDDLADKYDLADEVLTAAGFRWYEISNWAQGPGSQCRHNLGYWRDASWWGIGPGAHSHVGGVRWWNVRHPTEYAARLAAGRSPALGRELLGTVERHTERVMLGIRLSEGLPLRELAPAGAQAVPGRVAAGHLRREGGRVVLTRSGRLVADAVARDLLG